MDTLPQSASNGNPPRASGIYKITCTANNKIYIGSSVNLQKRKCEHFRELRRRKHRNSYLQHAWDKYGEETFVFEVVELVLPMNTTAREQYWLNKLKPFGDKGFNIARDADASALGRKRTLEHTEKIRQVHFGAKRTSETVEKMRQVHLGKKQSPETIEKIRQARLGKKHTLEAIEKMRQAKLGNEKIKQAGIGRKYSSETIEKMRQSAHNRKPISNETREKMRQRNLGKKISPETREKMRQAQKARWSKEK